jgi:murein DD-endopeptidase MepM/ murein hydrolase activator NlpD
LRQWYGHFAGVAPLWLRLAAPAWLPTLCLAHGGWPAPLLPLLAAALYALGWQLRQPWPLELTRLRSADACIMGLSLALAAVIGTAGGSWWPLLTLLLLAPLGWSFNWPPAGLEAGSNAGELPDPPAFQAPAEGPVTAGFRSYDATHRGLDIALAPGTPVRAPAAGRVVRAGPWQQWGWCVLLDHGEGWQTLLAHLERPLTRRGATVVAGEVVGRSGASGISSGPHLHFELRYRGQAVDPAGKGSGPV